MKKSVIGSVFVLLALLFALTPAAGAASGDPQAEYTSMDGKRQTGTFEDMWNKAAEEGGTVKLLQDVTADSNGSFGTGAGFFNGGPIWAPVFEFYTGKSITLDLNGKTIDRHLTSPRDNGYVIDVWGELSIQDSSTKKTGTITGGNTTENGGGVYIANSISNRGTLYMYGGNIANNKAQNGGGVFVANGAKFYFYGGKISENEARKLESPYVASAPYGGGIHVAGKSVLEVSGDAEIINNTASGGKGGIGGGIYNYSGNVSVSGSKIEGNAALGSQGFGGGIATYGGTLNISNGLIQNNTAGCYGGGVFYPRISSDAQYKISGNTKIVNNKVGDTLGLV